MTAFAISGRRQPIVRVIIQRQRDAGQNRAGDVVDGSGQGLRRGETGRPRPLMRIPSPWPSADTYYRLFLFVREPTSSARVGFVVGVFYAFAPYRLGHGRLRAAGTLHRLPCFAAACCPCPPAWGSDWPGALGLAQFMRTLLFGVTPADPLTLSAVVMLLVATAAMAAYLPARRANRVDPMQALRQQ